MQNFFISFHILLLLLRFTPPRCSAKASWEEWVTFTTTTRFVSNELLPIIFSHSITWNLLCLKLTRNFHFELLGLCSRRVGIETFPHKIVCYISQEWFQCFRSTFVSENSSKVPGRLMKCIHRRECITVGPQQRGRIIRAIFVLRNEISLRRLRISVESQHALCMRSSTTHRCRPSTHILPPMS